MIGYNQVGFTDAGQRIDNPASGTYGSGGSKTNIYRAIKRSNTLSDWENNREQTPEERLLLAILARALQDVASRVLRRRHNEENDDIQNQALHWLKHDPFAEEILALIGVVRNDVLPLFDNPEAIITAMNERVGRDYKTGKAQDGQKRKAGRAAKPRAARP